MANGIIIIDKPSGWTSMDVCAKLRGILHTKKVDGRAARLCGAGHPRRQLR